jgi:hypothetical protein
MTPRLGQFAMTIICALVTMARGAAAQNVPPLAAPAQASPAGLPRLIAMSGTLVDAGGYPQPGIATLTFALYADEQGGTPLWSETHSVQADDRGRYTVRLGSETPLQLELFQSTEARWLGVRRSGEVEPGRVRLLSVPYSLKAGDAETLGGLPASAYLRVPAGGLSAARAADVSGDRTSSTTRPETIVPFGFENSGTPFGTAYGTGALNANQADGFYNAAFGYLALQSNTTGDANTAAGYQAMNYNTTGINNTASGWGALYNNTSGSNNTVAGLAALSSNLTGNGNTVIGYTAMQGSTTGSNNVAIGNGAGYYASGDNNIWIAHQGLGGENGAIYLGTAGTHTKTVLNGKVGVGTANPQGQLHLFGGATEDVFEGMGADLITGPGFNYGYAGASFGRGAGFFNVRPDAGAGAPNPSLRFMTVNIERMIITNEGKVGIGLSNPGHPLMMASGAHVTAGGAWTNASSRTLKDNIVDLPAADAFQAFARLKPVTFSYKADPTERHVGFIAEDVPDLVATADRKGLAPMDIVAVVTKVVQDQQKTIQTQQAEIADLKTRLARLEALLGGQIK